MFDAYLSKDEAKKLIRIGYGKINDKFFKLRLSYLNNKQNDNNYNKN